MKLKPILLVLIFIMIGSSAVFAQAKLKRAKQLMDNLDYSEAIVVLNQMLEKDDNTEAKVRLADCYRKINDSQNAEYWYGQVVRLTDVEPINKLYYGQMLQRNGKCDLAKEWYELFIKEVPDDLRGQYLVKACDFEKELNNKNADFYTIKNCSFNSSLDDFGPTYYKNGVIFSSERDQGAAVKREHTWTGNPFLELYFVDYKLENKDSVGSFLYGRAGKFSKELNTKYHDASACLTKDQKEIYFTRNNLVDGKTGKSDDGIIKLKVFYAKSVGDNEWGTLESLPFNSDEYSVAHPTLSSDGNKLYFASDMPGGFGGMDIYVSENENGRWGPPLNLGPKINTEGNEVFPYIHESGRLYYSSDGLIGLGGLDIFMVTERGKNEWSDPENIGAPVNSTHDDFSIIMNEQGTAGHFSSDRPGGVGRDDIYSFTKYAIPVEIFVFDEETKLPLENVVIVNNCTEATWTTSKEGKHIADMKLNQCCTYAASVEGYDENNAEGCTKNITNGTSKITVEIPMKKKSNILVEGVIFDQLTKLPLKDATVTLSNPCAKTDNKMQTATTDSTGRFSFKVGRDCCQKLRMEKSNYLAVSLDSICTQQIMNDTILRYSVELQPIYASTELVNNLNGNNPNNTNSLTNNNANNNTTNPVNPGQPLNNNPNKSGKEVVTTDQNQVTPDSSNPNNANYANNDANNSNANTDAPTKTGVNKGKNSNTTKPENNGNSSNKTFDVSPSPITEGQAVPYLLHIYYDFDQAYIRDEAIPELEKMLKVLLDNPQYIVEIASHTDSRGTDKYNVRLSQRRADAVVRWLVAKGADKNRLVPRGYGELINVNNCKNNIPCSEKEHQMNRRTEFRVLGCVGCVTEDQKVLSRQNENTRVDPCQGCPF